MPIVNSIRILLSKIQSGTIISSGNISQWGGVDLTGRDITGDISKLPNIDTNISSINSKLAPFSSIGSLSYSFDNSTGTADQVDPISATALSVKEAIIKRKSADTGDAFLGDSTAQNFLIEPGDIVIVKVDDLSKLYVRTPVGSVTNLYVLYFS